jgi:hypothetical protein
VAIAAVLASSTAWTAQLGLTSTQARNIAKFKTVAVLVAVPDEVDFRLPPDVCTEIEAIAGWEFKKQMEDHAARLLSTQFSVVPKAYDSKALRRIGALGQIPRSALPSGDDVDGFIVLWGDAGFWHPAGLPAPSMAGMGYIPNAISAQLTIHDSEVLYVTLKIDIIDAKSRKTIARKELQTAPSYSAASVFNKQEWITKGPGAKVREEPDWACGKPLTPEMEHELRDDYRTMIHGILDYGFPLLRLSPAQP